jgi:hypothetical protein
MDGWASGPAWNDVKILAPKGIRSQEHSARSESLYRLRHPTRRLNINPSNVELNRICHLLALLGAHHILHVSRIRVNASQYKFLIEVKIISHSKILNPLFQIAFSARIITVGVISHLTPNGHFSSRTAPLTYRFCIFYLFNTYMYWIF